MTTFRTSTTDIYFADIKANCKEQLTDEQTRAALINKEYNKAICGNLRIVITLANKVNHGQFLTLDDLIMEGNLALINAVHAYDVESETPFGTFAAITIKNALKNAFGDLGFTIRTPRNRTERTYADSIDTPLEGDEKMTLEDILKGDMECDTFSEKEHITAQINAIFGHLDKREREIVRRSFGIGQELPESDWKIAQDLHICEERVRQIKVAAIERLKQEQAKQ